jgi:hypothetical protein
MDDPPHLKVLKDFLKWILESPEVMDDPLFSKNGIFNDILVETYAQLERKKASDEKKQKVVSAAVVVNNFVEDIDPNDYPTLNAKQICLKTDKDIMSVLNNIIKLSKKVKSVDLLKVLNYNDEATSLVEVPCSAKQSAIASTVVQMGT